MARSHSDRPLDRRRDARSSRTARRPRPERRAAAAAAEERWSAPRFEVIPLACEITAYAPDDTPLF